MIEPPACSGGNRGLGMKRDADPGRFEHPDRLDLARGGKVRRIEVPGGPAAIATGAGAAWVASEEDGVVTRLEYFENVWSSRSASRLRPEP